MNESEKKEIVNVKKILDNNQKVDSGGVTTKSGEISTTKKIIIIAVIAILIILLVVLLIVFLLKKHTKKEKLIIDVDEGQDDITLIILAKLNPKKFDILGVTVMSPQGYIDSTIDIHHRVRDYMGFDYPIYKGFNEPSVRRDLGTKELKHNYGFNFPVPYTEQKYDNAIEFIIHALEDNDEVTIINAGPSTNIPYVVKNYPNLVHKIKRIVMMGGTLNKHGNIGDCENECEYNIWVDPEGARILLQSKIPIVMVSADLTNVDLYDDKIMSNIRAVNNKYSSIVLNLWAGSRITWNDFTAHDPHIILYMLHKELFKTKKTRLDVKVDATNKRTYGVLEEQACSGKECNCIYVDGYKDEEKREKYWNEFRDILALKKMD